MPGKKVVAAMSGGVDSSLAADRLKEAGYDVTGVHLKLVSTPGYPDNLSILEQTCKSLEIPLEVLDLTAEFQSSVIDYFCREYGRGRTPNPCPVCNKLIKFGRLRERAWEMRASYLATGHYARIEDTPAGCRLLKASDKTKDQSYFLYALGQAELKQVLLPLGTLSKEEVRSLATERGLPGSRRRESHDLCFIPGGDYRSFLAGHISAEPGNIVDTDGRVLGRHHGLANYTVGQRQGLGISSNERRYVLKLDAAANQLVVGRRAELGGRRLSAGELSWVSGEPPQSPDGITAKIRYQSPEAPVRLSFKTDNIEVEFEEAQPAIAPGQAIVFYQGDILLGGGIIEKRLD
jgi:tRNA-specific 2-thiouridylase